MNIYPALISYNKINDSNFTKTNNFSPKLKTLSSDCVSFGMAKLNNVEQGILNAKVYTQGMIDIFKNKLTFKRKDFDENNTPFLSYEDQRLINNAPDKCIKEAMNKKIYGEDGNVSAFRAANQEGFRWFAKRDDINEIALEDLRWQKSQTNPQLLDTCLELAIIQDAFTEVVNALKPSVVKQICKFDKRILELMDADHKTILLKKLGNHGYKSVFGADELNKAKHAKNVEMFLNQAENRKLNGSQILKLIEMGKFDELPSDDRAKILIATLSMQEGETKANYEPQDGKRLANIILELALHEPKTTTKDSIDLINLAKTMQEYCADNGSYFNFENPEALEETLNILEKRVYQ